MILAFQQIGIPASAVLFEEHNVISSQSWDPQKSRDLLGNLVDVLRKAKVEPDQLKGIFMVNGPGNFTPVRISCVVANTFARELNMPIYEISSTEYEEFEDKNLMKIFQSLSIAPKKSVQAVFGMEPKIGS